MNRRKTTDGRGINALKSLLLLLVAVGSLCISARTIRAADEQALFKVRVRETQGLNREAELVRVPLMKEHGALCVTDAAGKLVPSQIVETADSRAIWFAADVPAREERVYHIKRGAPREPDSPLAIVGLTSRQQETLVRNRFYTATLMPGSAQLNCLIAAGDPRWILYNEATYRGNERQIGPIHWTPDVLSLVRTPKIPGHRQRGFWPKTYQWTRPPGLQESRGPLLYRIRRRGPIYFFTEVNAEVVYLFSALAPEIIVESTMSMDRDLDIRFLRNGEWVFKSGLLTRGMSKDQAGQMHQFSLKRGHGWRGGEERPIHPEDPWLALYNPGTGLGFVIVREELRNTGPDGGKATLANYSMVVFTFSRVLEVARKLVGLPGGDRDPRKSVMVKAGNVYYMREAIFTFDAREKDAFERLDRRAQRLRHPLKVEQIKE